MWRGHPPLFQSAPTNAHILWLKMSGRRQAFLQMYSFCSNLKPNPKTEKNRLLFSFVLKWQVQDCKCYMQWRRQETIVKKVHFAIWYQSLFTELKSKMFSLLIIPRVVHQYRPGMYTFDPEFFVLVLTVDVYSGNFSASVLCHFNVLWCFLCYWMSD